VAAIGHEGEWCRRRQTRRRRQQQVDEQPRFLVWQGKSFRRTASSGEIRHSFRQRIQIESMICM